jgi:hypothetical protein
MHGDYDLDPPGNPGALWTHIEPVALASKP